MILTCNKFLGIYFMFSPLRVWYLSFIILRVWPHAFLRTNVQGKFCWWLLSSCAKSRLIHHLPKTLQVYSITGFHLPDAKTNKNNPLDKSYSISWGLCHMNTMLWITAKHSCEAEVLGYGVSNTAGMELIPFQERW